MDGVSCVICTHNGRERLPATLNHLLNQNGLASIPWEILVVDNASTDGTKELLEQYQNTTNPHIHVIDEPRLGQLHARRAGAENARFDFVAFVDDDNWVNSSYIAAVYDLMVGQPEMGACGGPSSASMDCVEPVWFRSVSQMFAVGSQWCRYGDVTSEKCWLWGAGLAFRRQAILPIFAFDFPFSGKGRAGKSLQAGDDVQLCLAIVRAGWRIYYDERMALTHYMNPSRLSWTYVKALSAANGAMSVDLGLFGFADYFRSNGYFGLILSILIGFAHSCAQACYRVMRLYILKEFGSLRELNALYSAARCGRFMELNYRSIELSINKMQSLEKYLAKVSDSAGKTVGTVKDASAASQPGIPGNRASEGPASFPELIQRTR